MVVDPEAKREAQRNLAEAQERLSVCEGKVEELTQEESEIRKENNEFKTKHVSYVFILGFSRATTLLYRTPWKNGRRPRAVYKKSWLNSGFD